MRITFSQYQWGLLKILRRRDITLEEAPFIDQRPFNSLCFHGYVTKHPNAYSLSARGLDALKEYDSAKVVKQEASTNLGRWVRALRMYRGAKSKGASA